MHTGGQDACACANEAQDDELADEESVGSRRRVRNGGARLYTISRSGRVVALSARTGRVLWTHNLSSLGYSTPAIANGRLLMRNANEMACFNLAE